MVCHLSDAELNANAVRVREQCRNSAGHVHCDHYMSSLIISYISNDGSSDLIRVWKHDRMPDAIELHQCGLHVDPSH
jgi:hypothetical protein